MNTKDKSTCQKCGCQTPSDAPSNLCSQCVLEGVASSPRNQFTGMETARFSLAAALCTGLGLVLMFSAAMIGSHAVFLLKTVTLVIMFVLAASLSITGIILGANVLSAIRRSGGQMAGLGMAVFATVAWPLLLMIALSTGLLQLLPVARKVAGLTP